MQAVSRCIKSSVCCDGAYLELFVQRFQIRALMQETAIDQQLKGFRFGTEAAGGVYNGMFHNALLRRAGELKHESRLRGGFWF